MRQLRMGTTFATIGLIFLASITGVAAVSLVAIAAQFLSLPAMWFVFAQAGKGKVTWTGFAAFVVAMLIQAGAFMFFTAFCAHWMHKVSGLGIAVSIASWVAAIGVVAWPGKTMENEVQRAQMLIAKAIESAQDLPSAVRHCETVKIQANVVRLACLINLIALCVFAISRPALDTCFWWLPYIKQ